MSDQRTDTHGRIEESAAAVPVSPAARNAAFYLLDDLVAVALNHGVRLTDFDSVIDLPAACLKVASTLEHR
ncbi:hypothetical protein ACWGCC_30420 [Streptomyces nigrescens]